MTQIECIFAVEIVNIFFRRMQLKSGGKHQNKEIHIGKLMQKKITENGHTISWLARKMNRERSTIYAIFKSPHIHTSLLLRISIILRYDFFKHFSEYLATNDE